MKFYIWCDGTIATDEDIEQMTHMSDDYLTIDTNELSWAEVKEEIYKIYDHKQGFSILEEIVEHLN